MMLTGVPVSTWADEGETVWRTAIELLPTRRQPAETSGDEWSEVDENGVRWGG